jgi:hypothetical protein
MTQDARKHDRFGGKMRVVLVLLLFSPLFLFSLMAGPISVMLCIVGAFATMSFTSGHGLSSRKSALRVMTILSSLSLLLAVVALVFVLEEADFDGVLEALLFFLLCSVAAYFVLPATILVSADRIFQMRLMRRSVSVPNRDWVEPILALVLAVISCVLGFAAFCLSPLFLR